MVQQETSRRLHRRNLSESLADDRDQVLRCLDQPADQWPPSVLLRHRLILFHTSREAKKRPSTVIIGAETTEISCGQSTSSGTCRLSLETWGTPRSRATFATPGTVARWHRAGCTTNQTAMLWRRGSSWGRFRRNHQQPLGSPWDQSQPILQVWLSQFQHGKKATESIREPPPRYLHQMTCSWFPQKKDFDHFHVCICI